MYKFSNLVFPNLWQQILSKAINSESYKKIVRELNKLYSQNKIIYPQFDNILRPFSLTSPNEIKVVILGQDPYHTPNVADGLAFSTFEQNKVPPSLKNIYKEIIAEFKLPNYEYFNNPDLTRWAKQGVFLINNTLTVEKGVANSHHYLGWETFTDEVIKQIALTQSNVVYMLWGKFAQSKRQIIEKFSLNNYLILESAHPSPFSAYKGFFGNNHFCLCNKFLQLNNIAEINW